MTYDAARSPFGCRPETFAAAGGALRPRASLSACQRCQRPLAAKGTPYDELVPQSQKDPLTLLRTRQLGKRRRDKRAFSVPPGRRLAGCAKSRKGSSDVIGTVPKAPKDPLPLLAPCQLGKRRRDKRGFLVPAGRRLAGCAKNVEGSFWLCGTAPDAASGGNTTHPARGARQKPR